MSVATFHKRFPEFCEELDERIQMFLDDAALFIGDESYWNNHGDFYEPALLYYAAHLLAVGLHTESGDTGSLAPVRKQEVDDVIIEQAVSAVSPTTDDLYSTSYGKRYVNYRRLAIPTFILGV